MREIAAAVVLGMLIAATPEAIPIHDWQKEELDRRKANVQAKPASGLSWEELQRRVRSRHGR